ncbi:unnamed protein product, partial [marine sediment metagenome]
ADVWEWFRMVEIPPFWRENLTKLIWEIPTRVDVLFSMEKVTI